MALLFLLLFLPVHAWAALPEGPFEDPGFYSLWGGGNCVWFAWVIAYREWGVRLPWAGDARNWADLAGRAVSVGGKVYRIEASAEPVPGSVAVMQPEYLRWWNGGPYDYDWLGHVAWVTDVKDIRVVLRDGREIETGWRVFNVLESGVYPPGDWDIWRGCRYRKTWYLWPPDGRQGLVFLTVAPA